MALFDKLFGKRQKHDSSQNLTPIVQLQKGDTFISAGDNYGFKIIRPLTQEQKEQIRKSTILLRTGQLYMHYWTDNLVDTDRNDPAWQNKIMFFWKTEEPFPKKSLPKEFETFTTKHFLFTGDTSKISLQVGQALPWFGMPGLGEKHVCQVDGEKLTIPELKKLGLVEYVEPVDLANDNSDILTNKEDFFFLIDEKITSFQNGDFYLKGICVPIDLAYSVGGIHIMRKSDFE